VTLDIPPKDVITGDNVTIKVRAVLYLRVLDPSRAVTEVADYLFPTIQLAQTTLRAFGGQTELDELLAQRDKLNARIQDVVDAQTEPWGIKVMLVELKNIDLPQEMQRPIAAQAEAERARCAKVIAAEGEFQAAQPFVRSTAERVEVRGVGKSAVSGRFVVGIQRRLFELVRRDLSGLAPGGGLSETNVRSADGGRACHLTCSWSCWAARYTVRARIPRWQARAIKIGREISVCRAPDYGASLR
jgi:hypothetical protein